MVQGLRRRESSRWERTMGIWGRQRMRGRRIRFPRRIRFWRMLAMTRRRTWLQGRRIYTLAAARWVVGNGGDGLQFGELHLSPASLS